MKLRTYLAALAPLALASCVVERPVPVTTTTVQTDVAAPVATGEIVVAQPPPPVRIETRTVAPGPNYVWHAGHWRWTGTTYAWVPGHWVVRPRVAAIWVEGHWARRPTGWVWVEGHWR